MINCNCCKGCTERHVGCHSTCPDYIAFRNELDEHNAQENARKAAGSNMREYKSEVFEKYQRRMKRR